MKILIVDDNTDDRRILHQYLLNFADEVLEESDGALGFSTAMRERPDLIISDILMPNVDGFNFLREIRRNPILLHTPFIFYTAVYTGAKDEELAISLGVDDFIAKPQEPEAFLTRIKEMLDGLDITKPRPGHQLLEEDELYLREYSQVVAARLEDKVRELEKSNKKIAAQKTHYRNLFNSIRDVLIIADPSRRIIDINQPALRETFGYENEEVMGKTTDQFYASTEAFAQVGEEYFDLTDPQQAKLLEVEFRRKNGEHFFGELLAQKLVNEFGQPIGNIGVVRDVTDQRKTEELLRQSQKMESIGTLAGGVAHDFNNILAVIIGNASLAYHKMDPQDPMRIKLEHILEAGDRASYLIKELLLFSRKKEIEQKASDINQIVSKTESFLKRLIPENIEFVIHLQQVPLPVFADVYQLEQVLMNLATNARDAMPNGGTLTLTTEIIEMSEGFAAALNLKHFGDYALITLSDSGSGMNEATRNRVFEPFFTSKEVGQGTGLGLSVALGIIQQHNGQINVYSELGKGTSFRIYLPLHSDDSAAAVRPKSKNEPTFLGGSETILLAEDSELVRDLYLSVLSEAGYRVIVASDGVEAVEQYLTHQEEIDLLLFDLVMPKMSGQKAYEAINEIHPGIKALFSSGYAPDSLDQKLFMENGYQIISKPATPDALLSRIREMLDEGKF